MKILKDWINNVAYIPKYWDKYYDRCYLIYKTMETDDLTKLLDITCIEKEMVAPQGWIIVVFTTILNGIFSNVEFFHELA